MCPLRFSARHVRRFLGPLFAVTVAVQCAAALAAAEPVTLAFGRGELEAKWEARIRSLLAKGMIPLVDMESSLRRDQMERYVPAVLPVMDALGIALISFDGYQRPKDGTRGYRWSTYILDLVNRHPDRFIPTANGGTNPNWLREKGGGSKDFIDQMEAAVRGGQHAVMGEFEFRHYMSNHQCREGRTDRDVDIPLDGRNGHRVFRLAAETGVPFIIHLEAEDEPLAALERMLTAYPKAPVIVAHFGVLRHPERQTRFTPGLVRRLLAAHPNLHYDLAVTRPGQEYACTGVEGDTVFWLGYGADQMDAIKDAYKAILTEFSGRFLAATDYGGGRPPLPDFLRREMANLRRILDGLPEAAQHDIAYRNAWRLLTGRPWVP